MVRQVTKTGHRTRKPRYLAVAVRCPRDRRSPDCTTASNKRSPRLTACAAGRGDLGSSLVSRPAVPTPDYGRTPGMMPNCWVSMTVPSLYLRSGLTASGWCLVLVAVRTSGWLDGVSEALIHGTTFSRPKK